MAIWNIELTDKEVSDKGLEIVIEQDIPFNVRYLTNDQTSLVMDALKYLAFKPIGLYNKKEAINQRLLQESAKELINEFSTFVELGLVRLEFRKDSHLPF